MFDARLSFCALTLIKVTVIGGQITSDSTQLLNILTAALGALIIELSLETAVQARINGEVKCEIGNIQSLKSVVNNLLNGLGVFHKG